jgi:hypothetical protein
MDGAIWFMGIFLAALFCVAFALTFVPFVAKWSAYRHSVTIGVDLPSRLQPAVSSRLMTGARGAVIGGVIFAVVAVVAATVGLRVGDEPQSALWLFLGAVIAGGTAGTTVAALTGRRAIPSDRPRVARAAAVTVADYMSPLERIGARAVVILSIVAAISAVVAADDDAFPVVLFASLAAITLVLFEVASRRLVDRSEPAGSTAELVWDDAIRALILRDMITAPLTMGAFSLLLGLAHVVGDATGLGMTTVTGLIPTVVVLASSFYSRASRPRRYFITRLWPNLRWSDTAESVTDAA